LEVGSEVGSEAESEPESEVGSEPESELGTEEESGLQQYDIGSEEESGLQQYDVGSEEKTGLQQYNNIEQPDSNKKQFIESLDNVITYLSDSIAEKISQQISLPQSNDGVQNGFNSVNNVVKTMATKSLSGGKKKKTVHFRLTSKNNTKKSL